MAGRGPPARRICATYGSLAPLCRWFLHRRARTGGTAQGTRRGPSPGTEGCSRSRALSTHLEGFTSNPEGKYRETLRTRPTSHARRCLVRARASTATSCARARSVKQGTRSGVHLRIRKKVVGRWPSGPKPALDAFAIVVVEGQITAARNN